MKTRHKILNKKSFDFMEQYLNTYAPTGFEKEGQKVWLKYLKPYIDEYTVDNYGSVVGIINPKAKYKVVIEAHADEIAWYVKYITKEGFLHVTRNGGSDHQIAPSKRVKIFTPKGEVKGVFGWPAIHTRMGEKAEKKPEVETIWVDIGASSDEEAKEMGVHVGCVCSFTDGFDTMADKYIVSRALDNRMGGVMIAEVARLLHKNKQKLPFGLYIVNAVQEEVGLNGARMIADSLKPDVAIVTDVIHDSNTPMMSKPKLGDVSCGKGPVLTYTPAVHNILQEIAIETAQENDIPYQLEASYRWTGTDTDAFAYSNGGTPSILISLPLRYMHTTVEMVHVDDIEETIRLMYETLQKLTPKTNFKYLK